MATVEEGRRGGASPAGPARKSPGAAGRRQSGPSRTAMRFCAREGARGWRWDMLPSNKEERVAAASGFGEEWIWEDPKIESGGGGCGIGWMGLPRLGFGPIYIYI